MFCNFKKNVKSEECKKAIENSNNTGISDYNAIDKVLSLVVK